MIRWLAISALALATGPAWAHDEPDWKPPTTQGTEPRPAPGDAVSRDADDPPATALGDDPPARDSRSSRGVQPGDAFGAASPEIEEPDAPRKDDAAARHRREWLESIWSLP
jgi:hypothetical protein